MVMACVFTSRSALCGSNTIVRFDHSLLGFCVWYLFCYAVLSVLTSFEIILIEKKELVVLLRLHSWCLEPVSVLWLFPTVPWVGLWRVIVVFPNHTHYLYDHLNKSRHLW